MKDRWNVINTTLDDRPFRQYLFGDLSDEYTDEEIKLIDVVPYEKWTADDFADILANEYEDANYHHFVDIPYIILDAIRAQGLGYDVQDNLMRQICEDLYKAI
jgi:hypothetical protein